MFEGMKALNNFEQAINVINPMNDDKLTLIDPNSLPKEMNFMGFITTKIADLVNMQLKRR